MALIILNNADVKIFSKSPWNNRYTVKDLK